MAKIERFEDLQSWQKARQLANLIYDVTLRSVILSEAKNL